jgi:hypothetical protein
MVFYYVKEKKEKRKEKSRDFQKYIMRGHFYLLVRKLSQVDMKCTEMAHNWQIVIEHWKLNVEA